jgi:hypothetical protein
MNKSLAVIFLTVIAIAAVLWQRPGGDQQPVSAIEGLPWQIETLANGSSRVFGLELGRSTLDDARERFGDDMKVGIVAAQGEDGALEAYYNNVTAGVIAGKLILVAALDKATLTGLRERATQKVHMNDATYRYLLNNDDLLQSLRAPIATIAFIPVTDLDAETVLKRFGQPQERLRINDQVEHFLYPDQGLDLILDDSGKEVLQYVAPREFARLRDPLHGADAGRGEE